MPASTWRESVRVATAALVVAACAAAPIAAVEAFLVLVSFGNYVPRWWLVTFAAGLGLGVAYRLIRVYNGDRP